MFASMFVILVFGIEKVGGRLDFFEYIKSQSERLSKNYTYNISFDPDPLKRHTFWTVTVGFYFWWLAQCGVSQGMVQRYLAVPDLKTARLYTWFLK
jgi:Na+/proline symporter